MIPSKEKRLPITFGIFIIGVCTYLLHIGVLPFVNPDTTQYLHGSAIRPPIYTALLQLNQLITVDPHFYLTFILQLIAGVTCSIYAGRQMQSMLSLPIPMGYLFSTIFFIPYFFGDYKFANRLLSEGISYPLYLFGFSNLLSACVKQQIKPYNVFLISLYFMILTRPQMMFLYPIALVAWLYIALYFNVSIRKKTMILLSLIAVIIGANLTDRSYHYVKHGHFATEPMFDFALAVPNLFLSTESDSQQIPHKENKVVFLEIKKNMQALKINNRSKAVTETWKLHYHYISTYNSIMWDSLYKTFEQAGITSWYRINQLSANIAWPLLKIHWKKYLQLYTFSIRNQFGGYYGLLFCVILLLGSFLLHLKNRDKISLLVFFTLLTAFSNYMSVALLEPILRRYSIYTESFQLCLLLGIAYLAMHQVNNRRANRVKTQ
jgi:hypothetical protein